MQRDYCYERSEPVGRNFDPEFKPDLTPAEILRLGVFSGKYMTDCGDEFPASWFKHAKLANGSRDRSLNYFGVDASQPLAEWRRKGWIHPDDPRGWFQWYCRYYMGRRMPDEDARQMADPLPQNSVGGKAKGSARDGRTTRHAGYPAAGGSRREAWGTSSTAQHAVVPSSDCRYIGS